MSAALIVKEQLWNTISPESEGRAPGEKHRLGFGLWFFKEAEEGVVFDTDLPQDFTAVPAAHHKLQSVLI